MIPLRSQVAEEPLDLSYEFLAEAIQGEHENPSLSILALKELLCRVLYRDLDKPIATDKFFAGSKPDSTLNALSYSDTARA